MKKKLFGIAVGMVFVLIVGVFVSALDSSDISTGEITDSGIIYGLEQITKTYINKFVEKRGINEEDISGISEINFEQLPKEVNIENIGNHNLAIHEVNYTDPSTKEDKNVFVVTYSVNKLRTQGDLIIAHDKREILNFGFSGSSFGSHFLETATGVESSLEKGYVMMRKGSITGMSTNLEVIGSGESEIKIVIYKNGEEVNFGNSLSASEGIQTDYDMQSKDSIKFEQGDVVSVELRTGEGISWQDVITMVEITVYD